MGWKKKEKGRKETKNQKDGWRLEDREGGRWSDIRVMKDWKWRVESLCQVTENTSDLRGHQPDCEFVCVCVFTSEDQDEQQEAGKQAHGGNQDVEEKAKVIGGAQLVGTRLPAHPRLGSSSQILCGTQRDIQGLIKYQDPGYQSTKEEASGSILSMFSPAPFFHWRLFLQRAEVWVWVRVLGVFLPCQSFRWTHRSYFWRDMTTSQHLTPHSSPPALNTAHSTTLSLSLWSCSV